MAEDSEEINEIKKRIEAANRTFASLTTIFKTRTVSYTHLDVYKRQG